MFNHRLSGGVREGCCVWCEHNTTASFKLPMRCPGARGWAEAHTGRRLQTPLVVSHPSALLSSPTPTPGPLHPTHLPTPLLPATPGDLTPVSQEGATTVSTSSQPGSQASSVPGFLLCEGMMTPTAHTVLSTAAGTQGSKKCHSSCPRSRERSGTRLTLSSARRPWSRGAPHTCSVTAGVSWAWRGQGGRGRPLSTLCFPQASPVWWCPSSCPCTTTSSTPGPSGTSSTPSRCEGLGRRVGPGRGAGLGRRTGQRLRVRVLFFSF